MDILKNIDELLVSWGIAPSLADMLDQFIAFALVLIVAFLADVLCRNILLKVVAHLIRKTKATWDDIVFDRKVLIHLSRMVAAILGFRLRMFLPTKGCNNYVAIGISAFVATLIAWLTSFLSLNPSIAEALPAFMHSDTPWHPLMACALFIVPGVPLINFVCDMLDGYIEVGMVRALNTLLMLFAMAFGIAFAIQVCHIDNFVKDLTMTPHHEYWEFAIAAAVSAMGFSTIFSIPRRLLPVVAVGGIIAVCFRNFVNLGPSNGNIGLDMGLSIGSLAGSALISIIVIKARHWFHTPHQCITIPSVIPMVPGVLMYRALFAFIDMHGVVGEVTVGMNNLIKASLAIICIALGVAIPNVFFRRFIADNRKRKLLAMLVERKKKNGEFVDLHEVEIK